MLVYIYNRDTRRIEKYTRDPSDEMPYTSGNRLTVDEFRGSSKSSLIWSDKRVMQTYNKFREYYGQPIFIGYAFKRIWEGGHAKQSQHYVGTAFDTGQNLDNDARDRLHAAAVRFGEWTYVEPQSLTPSWVHFDRRLLPPACARGGYISVSEGSRGVYVLTLQDALNAIGFTGGGLDGIFGSGTKNAVIRFQRANNLAADGIVGCQTWTELAAKATGIGQTSTVVNP